MFWVIRLEFKIDGIGYLDEIEEVCFFLLLVVFIIIFWEVGNDDFWDDEFFVEFNLEFFDGGVIGDRGILVEDIGEFVFVVFFFELDLVFMFLFSCVVCCVDWFWEFFIIVVVKIVWKFVFEIVGRGVVFGRVVGVDFWFSFIWVCCLVLFGFFIWYLKVFCIVVFVIVLFDLGLYLVNEVCEVMCRVIGDVEVEVLVFFNLVILDFGFVNICDWMGVVLFIDVDCLFGFDVMLV